MENAHNRVPHDILWKVLKEYGIYGHLLAAIQSLYNNCQSCVRINGNKSDCFEVQVVLRQGCVLSPLLFMVLMDKLSRTSINPTGIKISDVKIDSRLFADDTACLAESADELEDALDRFQEVYLAFDMKIRTKKTELMVISRETKQRNLHLNNNPINEVNRFKYLGVQFSHDRKQDGEIDR